MNKTRKCNNRYKDGYIYTPVHPQSVVIGTRMVIYTHLFIFKNSIILTKTCSNNDNTCLKGLKSDVVFENTD